MAALYFAACDPLDGPIRLDEQPSLIGVSLNPDEPWQPDGFAHGAGYVKDDRGWVAIWRLVIGGVEIEGRWACDRRRFLPVE